ncbi:hypothetical protein PR202_ga07700 [Eleusine coracana subsp. coracana]|uniref:THH1/TOM1/TOM3 domain-containing protein n=1 Tax=Eleusine coracana subsp. coracana TaxID=191504 RepID=A0AAV5BZD1_ELECO|nr:hypothetical protein PR202_ga07700 [Eleusine coracana subsp. coracana]
MPEPEKMTSTSQPTLNHSSDASPPFHTMVANIMLRSPIQPWQSGVSLFAAFGFLLYGGRLFLMLQRFPVESKGRRKKLQEVGYVTTICFSCFLIRCVMMCLNAFDKAANLDVLNHPILNFFYYLMLRYEHNPVTTNDAIVKIVQ